MPLVILRLIPKDPVSAEDFDGYLDGLSIAVHELSLADPGGTGAAIGTAAYIAPALLGAGRGVLDRAIAGTIADARRFRTTLVRPVGNDVFIEMERDVYGTR